MKNSAVMTVGISAPKNSPSGLILFLKYLAKIACPAGLGAFASTVSPPPVTAPETSAYFMASLKSGTSVPRYVIAALSLNAVKTVAPMNKGSSDKRDRVGAIHQDCSPPYS
ncbi:hypothetical protein CHS0354_026805 [Potamilus streckersoni]|uniref:Uncharacterized protein n=1 Tax=Potamilus streckersoni TaxID=2493646 RepID=A0AAE0W760_9BIVA|nr:hypothetical protein CHS0354_026805 [Potamilus streckersoni]